MGFLFGQVSQFGKWWVQELSDLVPAQLRGPLAPGRRELVVDLAGEQPSLELRTGQRVEALGSLDAAEIEPTQTGPLATALRLARSGRLAVATRLSPEHALRRILTLPLAAEADLDSAVSYQIRRISPFPPDAVRFVARLQHRDSQARRLTAEAIIVPLADLKAAEARVESWGLRVDRHCVLDSDGNREVQFDATTSGEASARVFSAFDGVLSLTAALLIAALFVLPIWQLRAELRVLQSELEQAKKTAGEVAAMEAALAASLALDQHVVAERQNRVPQIVSITELTDRLPDDTWIAQYQSTGNGVRILGFAPDASAIIKTLDEASSASAPRFVAPIHRDRETGLERFSIAYELEKKP